MQESQFIMMSLFLLLINYLQWVDRKKLRQERDSYRSGNSVKHTEIVLFGKRGKA